MKKKIMFFLGIVVLSILIVSGVRLTVGWKPFRNMQRNDLYYVGRISATDSEVVFLDEDEIDEFASCMREIRVFPCTTDWEEIGGLNRYWFVFEYENKKGEMILVKTFKMLVDINPDDLRHWVSINDDLYRIDAETYAQFDTFLRSLEN